MNALADTPATASTELQRSGRDSYALGLLAALAVHATVIFGWPNTPPVLEQVEFGVEAGDSSVEVALVAALPAEDSVEAVQPPPIEPPPVELPPPPPEVMPEPPPAPVKPPEMTIPEPAPVPKPAPPQPKLKLQNPAPSKPTRIAHASGDGSSAVPGNDAITSQITAGALSTKPGYLRNPHPAYPDAARAARQQGLVTLSVRVDARGHVASVRIVSSSGYPALDERARSTVAGRWAFKPARSGGVPIASEVVIPIRFTLNR